MKAYKGFDKDLKCRGFQYEVGKDYEEKEASLCNSGFHACLFPLDVLDYYPPTDNRFCEVDLDEVSEETSDDSKRCGKKIHIETEIKLSGLISAGVKFILDKVDWDNKKESNTGDYSAATNTGDQSAATSTGDYSAATNTGYQSAATVEGKDSVAIATGYDCKVKGALGCAIVAVERGEWNGKAYPLLAIKSDIIDGEKLKADTFYKVINGEWVECE